MLILFFVELSELLLFIFFKAKDTYELMEEIDHKDLH